MALSEILKLGSKVAGVASAIPGFAPFAAPISAVLGVAGNMVPQGNNNVNQGAVDVTGQLKGSSSFGFQGQPYINPGLYESNINLPKNYFNVSDPAIKPIVSSQYTPDGKLLTQPFNQSLNLPNMLPTGNINVQGNGSSSVGDDNTNNIPIPDNYFLRTNLPQVAPGVLNQIISNRSVVEDPNQKWLDMAAAAQGKTDKIVNQANTYNAIGQGITGVGSLLSIINEIGKQPSEMLQPAQYRTANLDSNQSAFINANMEQIKNSKNAQKRLLQDLGVDPMLAGINTENFASDQTLKVLSEAERTRQGILGSQEQINASIQAQANDSLQRTKMFNIQKQLQENQMGGANLSAAITGLAGSVMGFGSGTLANNYWGEITKANTRQSFLQTQ
jgi:hypothetical protein